MIAVMEDYVAEDGKYHPKPKAFPRPWQGDVLGRIRALGPNGPLRRVVVKIVEYHLTVNKEGGGSMIIQAIQTLGEMGPGPRRPPLPLLLKIRPTSLAVHRRCGDQADHTGVAVKPVDPMKPVDPSKPNDPTVNRETP